MKLILILTLLCSSIFAAESMDEMIVKLAVEDFDIRERATAELGKYPEEFAHKFLEMARAEKIDPEVQYRLRSAAFLIFCNTVLLKNDEWRLMHGSLLVESRMVYRTEQRQTGEESEQQQQQHNYYHHNYDNVAGHIVDWIPDDKPIYKILNRYDIIESIDDGNGTVQSGQELSRLMIRADKEYKLTVRRYKDTEKILSENNNNFINPDLTDFETLTLKVKAGWKDEKEVNPKDEYVLLDKLWKEFKNQYDKPAELPQNKTP